jgi:hypothetical protein
MTIAILKRDPGQTSPRLFARVATPRVMIETLGTWWDQHGHGSTAPIHYRNVDTDEPVLEWRCTMFYAFTEELHQ